jgi:hypothetical protein
MRSNMTFVHISHPDDTKRRGVQAEIRRHVADYAVRVRRDRRNRPIARAYTAPGPGQKSLRWLEQADSEYGIDELDGDGESFASNPFSFPAANGSPRFVPRQRSPMMPRQLSRSLTPLGYYPEAPSYRDLQLFHFSASFLPPA